MKPTLNQLMNEYQRSLSWTKSLYSDLTQEELNWRPKEDSSAIAWHLGHQAAVGHYMIRNLTSAEPSINPELDKLMDSATAERERGELPSIGLIEDYRGTVTERIAFSISKIDSGDVGAPNQLRVIAANLLVGVVNHEYQHSKWIGEVRTDAHGKDLPALPNSELITELDGYCVIGF